MSCPCATIVSVNMVELRTDVAGKQAVEALRQAEHDAGNARNRSQALEAYLKMDRSCCGRQRRATA